VKYTSSRSHLYSKQALALSLLPDGGQQLKDALCVGANAICKPLNYHVEHMEDLWHNREPSWRSVTFKF
jgi:hypothetical protein